MHRTHHAASMTARYYEEVMQLSLTVKFRPFQPSTVVRSASESQTTQTLPMGSEIFLLGRIRNGTALLESENVDLKLKCKCYQP